MTKIQLQPKRILAALKEASRQIQQAQIPMVASSLAYTTILSIIPLLAVSFAIFQAFGGLDKLYATIEPFILSNLAEGSSEEVMHKLRGFIANARGGAIGITGLIGLIITSMSMLSSIENAINRVWGAKNTRTYFQRISAYWLFITLGPLALAIAVGAATSSDLPITRFLPSGAGMFILTIGFFFAVYKWVPRCTVHWRFAGAAALFTSTLLNLAQAAFRLYTAKVLSYSKIYGSLGAVPILLLWVYILWLIVLSGAALSSAMQKRLEGGSPESQAASG